RPKAGHNDGVLPNSSVTFTGQGNFPLTAFGGRSLKVPSDVAPRSRAMPATPVQSGRLGVRLISITGSLAPAQSAYDLPTGASAGKSIMPSWSSEIISSAAEHSMPRLSTPRMVPTASVMFLPGMKVPGAEKTPFMPARAFGAPQTTDTGFSHPM